MVGVRNFELPAPASRSQFPGIFVTYLHGTNVITSVSFVIHLL